MPRSKAAPPVSFTIMVSIFMLIFLLLGSCSDEKISVPEAAPPLSRTDIGYAVVNVSYTRILDKPEADGVSLGFVREKTIMKVLERRLIQGNDKNEYWVLVEGNYTGWLPEKLVRVYKTEEKAKTAASEMALKN